MTSHQTAQPNTNDNPNTALQAWSSTGFVRKAIRSRVTGTVVRILDLTDPASPVSQPENGDRWGTACEHDLMVTQPRVKVSDFDAAHPEQWCDTCLAAALERGAVEDLEQPTS